MIKRNKATYPPLAKRLFSVWFRHMRVYIQNFFSNGLPPFLEPLLFLTGIGFGVGSYIDQQVQGVSYVHFLAMALPLTSAMFTASFECTFGTFVRLEFDKVYDGMLAAPLSPENLVVGEILWAGTKGFFFSTAVLSMLTLFGVVSFLDCLFIPLIGCITGIMFGAMGILVTSFVKTINHFSFYFSGVISPMFFFSGVVFPVSNLPPLLQPLAELAPLTHAVRLARAACLHSFSYLALLDLLYIVSFSVIISFLAARRLKKRLIA